MEAIKTVTEQLGGAEDEATTRSGTWRRFYEDEGQKLIAS